MAPDPSRREIEVLALSGGGFIGLYTAHVLQAPEARAGLLPADARLAPFLEQVSSP
jgi:predicted acylesterase/phospholipase RssA